jgi:NADH-quinone oxidoreductase subunit F
MPPCRAGGCDAASSVAPISLSIWALPASLRHILQRTPSTGDRSMNGSPEVVFAGTNGGLLDRIEDYESAGGFAALARARSIAPDDVIAQLESSNLRGRGGAGFPTGRKWAFVPKPDQLAKPHYLVVNADESEPGTFKDREIMLRVPFRFLEGCLIAAYAIQSQHVFIYIRGEYEREFEVLRDSLEAMRRRDLLGGITVVLHRGAGAYICGEETALLESLEGRRGQPRTKPPFPAVAGLYAAPTAVNNVESITTTTSVIELGGTEYAKLGVQDSTGTRVFSLSGNVVNPGNYELPHGISLRELIYDVGGGIPDGHDLKAVIPGGSSTPILTAADIDTKLDFTSLVAAGSSIGSAGVMVIDDRCCMVQLGIRVSQFYEHESCGKCTPCRVGTRWLTQILQRIEEGEASQADLDLLLSVCDRILGKCLCPLGDSDAIAVASYVARFRDEFQTHIDLRSCPFAGASSLEDILAPSAQHEHGSREAAHV